MTTTLPTRAQRRVGDARRVDRPLVRSGHLLVLNGALTAISGLAYWLVAARFYDTAEVGRNLAAISAISLLGGVAQANVMTALLRFVPYAGQGSARLVARGYALAAVLTAAAATVFVLSVGTWSEDLRFLRENSALAAWFVISVTVWALFSVQDHVLTATRRTGLVPVENLAFSILKLVLVVALAAALPTAGILLSWTVAAAVAVLATSGYVFLRALPRHMRERPVADPPPTGEVARFLALDYVASLAVFAAVSGLPLVVIAREGASATAGFLLAWTIVYSLYLVPLAMGQSLVAHSADPGADLHRDVRTMCGHALMLVLPGVLVLVALAPRALALFGPQYVEHADTLRLLALSATPNVLVELSVSAAQVRQRMRRVLAIRLTQGGGVIGLSLLLMPRQGVTGVAVAWLIVQTALAVGVIAGASIRTRDESDAATETPATCVSPAPSLTVTAIVCCYTDRRWDQLVAAVESLQAQDHPLDDVIVVVDHNPALLSRVRRRLTGITAVPSDGPPGLSGARNTGVRIARGDIVAFLDDDALAAPGWVAAQAAAYADASVVATAATIHPMWAGERPGWFPAEFDWVVGCSWAGSPTGQAEVRNAIGAGMTLRRSAVLAAGGFAVELGRVGTVPVGCEETDLCIRLRSADPSARIVTVPSALTLHRVPHERATFRYFRSRCWAEGVSKARVRARAATKDALGAERTYVTKVLPRAVLHALAERGVRRALAVPAGLAFTAAGYLVARLGAHRAIRYAALCGPLTAAVAAWLISLRDVDPGQMGDLGLLTVLPPAWFSALGAVVVLLALHIARGASGVLVALHLGGALAILHATPALLYEQPRYSWTFKHLGVVDYITRHGSVDPTDATLGVYHSWPGFFTLGSYLSQTTGIDPGTLSRWAPLAFQLAFLLPAIVAFRCLSEDPRRIWLGVSLFALANWVGQDYFAPQALTYLLLLCAIAVVLRWLPSRKLEHDVLARIRAVHDPAPVRREQLTRPGVAALVIALVVAIVSSHQLTPFVLIGTLAVLALHRHCAPGWTVLVAVTCTAVWIESFGLNYVRTHADGLLATLGRPDANAAESLASATLTEQVVVIWVGRGLVLLVLALAMWTLLQERRGGRPTTTWLLALTPLPLLLSTYDGEVVLRVYLFALPWLALLAAGAVYRSGCAAPRAIASAALLLTFTAAFTVAYYGKERANYFDAGERAANSWLFEHAEPGSVLVGAALDFPWKDRGYERFRYRWLAELSSEQRLALQDEPVEVVLDVMGESGAFVGYVFLSEAQDTALAYGSELPADTQDDVGRALSASPEFELVHATDTALIFRHEFLVEGATP